MASRLISGVVPRWSGCSPIACQASCSAISVRVRVVAIGASSVSERVTERIPANRTRTVTVRPARCLARSRTATRSARWPRTTRSSSEVGCERPRADCAPTDRARVEVTTRRGSSLTARAASLAPFACPSRRSTIDEGVRASCPIVRMPSSASCRSATGPTPHISRTGNGSRNRRSSSGWTTTRPSGLATWEATLARCFVRAAPTEIGSPTSSRTRRRSWTPMEAGGPKRCVDPETSRNASSMEIRCTAGVTSYRMSITASASLWYWLKCPRTNAMVGQSWRARQPAIPPCTPKDLASYEAASTTPPRALPPTAIGRPRRAGSSSCSTDA